MDKIKKLEKAIEETKVYFDKLSEKYGSWAAKKALYRIARGQSKHEALLQEKEKLDGRIKEVEKEIARGGGEKK